MYAKIFDSMYEGTLYGHWQAIVTLQQMLVLCDANGVIDMTPEAISGKTSIPLEIITKGIETLSSPDPHSRTPGEDGRRIATVAENRPWGWYIVNHAKYQHLKSAQEKREVDRVRIAEKRKAQKNNSVAPSRAVSPNVAEVAYSDTDTDSKAKAPPEKPTLQTLLDLGVAEQAAADWLIVRKAKRAPLTETAIKDLQREAAKAGISVAEAVAICARKSWQGFNASWNWKDAPAANSNRPNW